MAQLAAERDRLRTELQARGEAESRSAARISQLEAELRNERQNLADKLALLETAKQALAHQFEALAGEILEKKSKSFAEGSQKELGRCSLPCATRSRSSARRWRRCKPNPATASPSWRP